MKVLPVPAQPETHCTWPAILGDVADRLHLLLSKRGLRGGTAASDSSLTRCSRLCPAPLGRLDDLLFELVKALLS